MKTTHHVESPDTSDDVGLEQAEEFAREHPSIVKFGRIGWVAKGLVYGLTGVLALLLGIRAARGTPGSDDEASPTGAIARIAETSFGVALLILVAAGLIVYALWRLVSVVLPADNDLKTWATRGGYLVSALTYLVLAWTAITFVRHPGNPADGEDSKVESFSRGLMARSFGREAVAAIGVILIVIAAVFVWKAVSASFTKQLLPGDVGPFSHRMIVTLGRIGWVGRAGMMALIGFFLARAALRFDPEDAQGLDGSLRQAIASTVGTILVIAVGVGLLVYGVFCVVSAPKARLIGAES
jgi:hypothetical protein